jgi:ornithine carbamoyltransferase
MRFVCATPAAYMLPTEDVDRVMAQAPDMEYIVTNDPIEAVQDADAVYTDTWVSMGQEAERPAASRISQASASMKP